MRELGPCDNAHPVTPCRGQLTAISSSRITRMAKSGQKQKNGVHTEQENSLGIVVTTSPTCSRYSMVVLPAPSSPRIRMRISFSLHSFENREKNPPAHACTCAGWQVSDDERGARLDEEPVCTAQCSSGAASLVAKQRRSRNPPQQKHEHISSVP